MNANNFESDDVAVNPGWYLERNRSQKPSATKCGASITRGYLLVKIDTASQRFIRLEKGVSK